MNLKTSEKPWLGHGHTRMPATKMTCYQGIWSSTMGTSHSEGITKAQGKIGNQPKLLSGEETQPTNATGVPRRELVVGTPPFDAHGP